MSEQSPFIVLLQLFVILHNRLQLRQRGQASNLNLESFFISEINRLGFRAKHMDLVRAYFRSGKGKLPVNFQPNLQEMKEIVNSAYQLTCNEIGPVETDEFFGEAIRRVEKTAAGIAYSPKNFL